jgi:hypothetical protein
MKYALAATAELFIFSPVQPVAYELSYIFVDTV